MEPCGVELQVLIHKRVVGTSLLSTVKRRVRLQNMEGVEYGVAGFTRTVTLIVLLDIGNGLIGPLVQSSGST